MVAKQDDTNEVDLAIGGISESVAHFVAIGREGRYTITEAAQLKGVSYHTVSRAIRRGRLPVQRLGRMALISEEDLIAWRPMREKAPRKYRQPDPSLESPPSQLDVRQGQTLSLATRLSSFYEDIHLAASESSLAEFIALVCERFGDAVGLSRVAFWVIDETTNTANQVGAYGGEFNPFPTAFSLADIPFVLNFARQGQTRIVLDLKAELADWADEQETGGVEMLLSAPLRLRSRPIGLLCGDRNGQEIELTQEQLELAHRLANQVALAFEYNRSLRTEARHALQLAAVMEEVGVAICACDAQGRMTVLNATHRALAGYTEEEADSIIGMDACEYLSMNADRRFYLDGTPFPLDEHPLLRAMRGEHVHDIEYQIVFEDKEPVYISAGGTPMVIDGEIVGAVSTGREQSKERRDLEREREARRGLERRAERTEILAQTAIEMLGARTTDEINAIALRVFNRELQADFSSIYRIERGGKIRLIARHGRPLPDGPAPVYDMIALPNTATALASGIPTVMRRDTTMMLESRVLSSTDTATSLIVPLKHNGASLGVMFANFHKHRELDSEDYEFSQRLSDLVASALVRMGDFEVTEASMNRLLAVVDQLPQAMLMISYPAGEIIMANRAAEEMWGVSLREPSIRAEELTVIDIEGRRSDRDHHPLLRVLQTGEDYLGEPLTVERREGTVVDVLANHTPIHDANGLILGSVSVLQDRSNFKPLDRAKDEFLSVVAHEIRNPLTSLRGNLQLLERRVRRSQREDVEAEVRRIRSVIEQVDRISELVSRMLDISRADLGKLDLSVNETDASVLLQSVVTEVGGVEPIRDIRVTAPERVPVVWDEIRIQQVLVNLLTNAMRYAPEGLIEVTLTLPEPDTVSIAVRDHGSGVPPRIRKRLFSQYYRFDDGQEDREPALDGSRGLGIGLYISARLARAHGGKLEVDDAEGGGAVFTLVLPRIAETTRLAIGE
jgi:excisionase family DNA binding protein/PAS domain S-box-containing protein